MNKNIFFLFYILSTPIFPQNYFDLGELSFMTAPNGQYEDHLGDTNINEWNLALDLPLVLDEKNTFLLGLSGNSTRLTLQPTNASHPIGLATMGIKLGIHKAYSDNLNATFMAIPRISSDFANGLDKGLQLGFLALFNTKKTEHLKYTLGLYTSFEEFGLLVVPLLGWYYQNSTQNFEMNVLLPISADVNLGLGTKSRIGLKFKSLSNSYAIDTESFRNAYLNKASNDLMLYYEVPLSSNLLFKVNAGYAFFRSYRVFGEDDKVDVSIASIYIGDNRTMLNAEIGGGLILKTALTYRLYFAKKE